MIYLIPVERCRASISTSAKILQLVVKNDFLVQLLSHKSSTEMLENEVIMSFTLHTDPKEREVEFSISCLTRGGPATYVEWGTPFSKNGTNYETSQLILDTGDSVYDNRLLVKGRESGSYQCTVTSNRDKYFPSSIPNVTNELVLRGW